MSFSLFQQKGFSTNSINFFMMSILKRFVLIIMVALLGFSNKAMAQNADFDWNPVMNAIIQVESKGNPNARCGIYCGILQISPVLVKDCNQILKRRKSSKRYSLADRFNAAKSKEMFVLIQSFYNPQNNVERDIRMWQGGIYYNVRRTQRYYEKVMRYMN